MDVPIHTNMDDSNNEGVTQRPVQPAAPGVRPMRRDDLPAVEVVLNSAFKKTGLDRNFDFGAYVETLFFSSPVFDPEYGSVVYDAGESGVTSVILAVPMRFVANGKPITARLLCAFASKGKLGALGAARLSRGMRATKHDMLFSDTASPSAPIIGLRSAAACCRWKACNGTRRSSLSARLPCACRAVRK